MTLGIHPLSVGAIVKNVAITAKAADVITCDGNIALAEEYALSTDLADTKLPAASQFSLSEEETLLEPLEDSSVMSLR